MKENKSIIVLIVILCIAFNLKAQVNIIPRPTKMEMQQGNFVLNSDTKIISGKATSAEAGFLAGILEKGLGKTPIIKKKGEGILLKIDKNLSSQLGKEGYLLEVTERGVTIRAQTNTGIFYGIQSLRQILPSGFEFTSKDEIIKIPCIKITDEPRFSWRAFMLDEARHFQGMQTVKDLLDEMALLKMNTFHWHLTDDQGWRIEIKKYPKLTAIGGFRKDSQKTRNHPEDLEGIPHSGFYTQKQIKEIIRYATERHIEIVPEIEMPGHASAAITAYSWLGVLGKRTEVPVVVGKLEDSFNVADPRVYKFLEDVLKEVFALFPGEVVHIGGDEVRFEAWKNSEMMQNFMKEKDLESPADVQIYFTNKISNFIDGTNHRMMGWNEILGYNVHEWQQDADFGVKQELAKSAIIHFWKGDIDLIKNAVSSGYDVVNSIYWDTYLDYNYEAIPLSRAYNFEPIPNGLDPKYEDKILGAGCQLWTEWVSTREKLDNQVFPRLAAYAEVGWTAKSQKNWETFQKSLIEMEKRWKQEGIKYATEVEK